MKTRRVGPNSQVWMVAYGDSPDAVVGYVGDGRRFNTRSEAENKAAAITSWDWVEVQEMDR